ncbi:acylphosphatase-2-like isoform X3 [Emydura macquarii macquarii]|uniref:acylphosphatase-2-like isoform X3 n=1 Tax=Emydura macquarii macquarii TaxID=1129001 RepID=UPI00352B8010
MLCCKPLFTPTSSHLQPTTLAHAVPWLPQDSGPWITRSTETCKVSSLERKNWLRNVGSPMSRIDRAVFSNEREISALEFPNFTTKY